MGKHHRHKKQLKSEKAKTKLKGGKTKLLPKGQNVTSIAFKVKPIVLPEQLRPSTSSDPLSLRKLNLKDVLSRLRHHNVSVKVDNCQQLKELVESYSAEALRQNLAQMLQGVCPLMLDVEHKVRGEAVKVLRCLLSGIAAKDVEAFFNVLSTYLRCSMTHIDPAVQEDSLLLLDVLLEHAPSSVARNARQILPNFFTLISKLKGGCKPGGNRTLTQNLKSMQTSVRWRVKVLSSLKGIFEAMHCHEGDVSKGDECVIKSGGLYVDRYTGCPVDFFSDDALEEDAEEPMADYIRTLLPLLHETWMEVAPDLAKPGPAGESVVLKRDAADTLACVLEVLHLCWGLAEALDRRSGNSDEIRQAFRSKAMGDLLGALLKTFPYSRALQQPQKKGDPQQEKCLRENLLVCYVFCAAKQPRGKSAWKGVMSYINYCLCARNYVDPENVGLLVSLLKLKTIRIWKNEQLLGNALRFYQHYNKKLARTDAAALLVLLCEAIQGCEVSALIEKELPRLILGAEVHTKTLDFLLALVKRDDLPTVRGCFRQNLKAVLDNSVRIRVVDGADPFLDVIRILSLYYYVPLDLVDLRLLALFADDNPKYLNFVNYLINARNR